MNLARARDLFRRGRALQRGIDASGGPRVADRARFRQACAQLDAFEAALAGNDGLGVAWFWPALQALALGVVAAFSALGLVQSNKIADKIGEEVVSGAKVMKWAVPAALLVYVFNTSRAPRRRKGKAA